MQTHSQHDPVLQTDPSAGDTETFLVSRAAAVLTRRRKRAQAWVGSHQAPGGDEA